VTNRDEILEASDQTIHDAIALADPMVLRGLLYQLTGDESLANMQIATETVGYLRVHELKNQSDVDTIRARAETFLHDYRDAGASEPPIGPSERLPRSLALVAGEPVPEHELEFFLEELALNPWARGTEWSAQSAAKALADFSVLIIGAGLGGLNAAVHLKRLGIPFRIVDKNPDVGGTWYENRYPGCRVDSPSRMYKHIFGVNYVYPGPFCVQADNEKYFNWVADTFDVRGDVDFETEVLSLAWDDAESRWVASTTGPAGQREYRADAVISSVGFLSRPNVPNIEGAAGFNGALFHASRWSADLEIAGKRIAVIGSGCTSYQMVPQLVRERAAQTYIFQRTPSWCFDVPGYLDPFDERLVWLEKNFPYLSNFSRFRQAYLVGPERVYELGVADPEWQDPLTMGELNQQMRNLRLEFMQKKFADRPDLLENMLPQVPPLASRPVLVDPNYSIYDVLLSGKTLLITEGIRRITERGIETVDDVEHEVDVIVYATGYRAQEYLAPMHVTGRDGVTTGALWAEDGPRAYLGSMLPGFPNFFMVYGPNTNGAFQTPTYHELMTRFALECIRGLIEHGRKTIEVTPEAYWRFNREVDRAEAQTIWGRIKADNYFTNAKFDRSPTQAPFHGMRIWRWLRDPLGERGEDAFAIDAIDPRVGGDLVMGDGEAAAAGRGQDRQAGRHPAYASRSPVP
jgi:4-hydroxyacetophenone monooxygenase